MLGLHATRMQIDVLLADVSDRDERIANLTAQAAERDAIIQQMQEEFRVFQFELDSAAQVCIYLIIMIMSMSINFIFKSNYAKYQIQIAELNKKVKDLTESIINFEKERALLQSQFKNLRNLSAEVKLQSLFLYVNQEYVLG